MKNVEKSVRGYTVDSSTIIYSSELIYNLVDQDSHYYTKYICNKI